MEDARSGLLRQAGLDLHDFYLSSNCVFPIIKTATKHIFPLRYGDAFICRATVAECKEKLVIDFEIRLKEGGRVCVKGRTEQVAVQMPSEMQFELPAAIRSAGDAVTRPFFHEALASGAEQVAVWSQLLDPIDVFPVADGDTGRNLVISLAPLRQQLSGPETAGPAVAARGNSGNIAASFLQEFALCPRLRMWRPLCSEAVIWHTGL